MFLEWGYYRSSPPKQEAGKTRFGWMKISTDRQRHFYYRLHPSSYIKTELHIKNNSGLMSACGLKKYEKKPRIPRSEVLNINKVKHSDSNNCKKCQKILDGSK